MTGIVFLISTIYGNQFKAYIWLIYDYKLIMTLKAYVFPKLKAAKDVVR